jgi:hypothetical protein
VATRRLEEYHIPQQPPVHWVASPVWGMALREIEFLGRSHQKSRFPMPKTSSQELLISLTLSSCELSSSAVQLALPAKLSLQNFDLNIIGISYLVH